MKTYLLAGTSALALALTAGAANAQSAPGKFDIKLTGDAYIEGGYVGQQQHLNAGGVDFENRFRLVINPVATADNGITYGAKARIRANSSAGTIDGDQAYVYVSGNFGEFRGGVQYGPSDVTYVSHPQDWQLLGIYDQWRSYTPSANGSSNTSKVPLGYMSGATPNASGPGTTGGYAWGQFNSGAVATSGVQLLDSHNIDTKLVYYSPRFFGLTPTSGLQGAVSYAPRNGGTTDALSVNTDVNRQIYTPGGGFQRTYFDDTYELTANYNETFSGVSVKASAGYAGGSAHQDSGVGGAAAYSDLESFQFGGQIGYANFVLGGGYVWGGKSGYTKAAYVNSLGTVKSNVLAPGLVTAKAKDQTAWNVGGQYTFGAWVFGVKYLEETDAGNLAYTGSRTLGAVTAGTMYTVAPGLRVGAEYTHFDATSNVPAVAAYNTTSTANANDSGDVILLRTVVNW